jgi:hypothetical protein
VPPGPAAGCPPRPNGSAPRMLHARGLPTGAGVGMDGQRLPALPGFTPHPYRDYSAPWFDGRPVLRGASFMTQPRMKHPRYRNYFHRRAQRRAGRLSQLCALAGADQPASHHTPNQPCASVQCCTSREAGVAQQRLERGGVHLYEFSVWMRSPAAKRRSPPGQRTVSARGPPGASRCARPPCRSAPRCASGAVEVAARSRFRWRSRFRLKAAVTPSASS